MAKDTDLFCPPLVSPAITGTSRFTLGFRKIEDFRRRAWDDVS
jgi:hypothetical protein